MADASLSITFAPCLPNNSQRFERVLLCQFIGPHGCLGTLIPTSFSFNKRKFCSSIGLATPRISWHPNAVCKQHQVRLRSPQAKTPLHQVLTSCRIATMIQPSTAVLSLCCELGAFPQHLHNHQLCVCDALRSLDLVRALCKCCKRTHDKHPLLTLPQLI